MRFYFLGSLKRKVNIVIRMIIIISFLILLLSKLVDIFANDLMDWFEEDKPSGNPLRVQVEEGFEHSDVE